MPFHIESRILRDEMLVKMGINRGLNEIDGKKFYISRGIGNVMLPFRFLSKPEVIIVDV